MWEFSAMSNGYAAAHAGGGNKLTEVEAEELFAWVDEGEPPATPGYRYEGEFGARGFWLDGIKMKALPNG